MTPVQPFITADINKPNIQLKNSLTLKYYQIIFGNACKRSTHQILLDARRGKQGKTN